MKRTPFKTIRSAVIFCFSTLILVTLAIFYRISLNYTQETVLDNSIDYTSRLVNQVNSDIDFYINYMQNISSLVIRNADVQEYFFGIHTGEDMEQRYQRILTQFQTIIETRNDISNIAVVAQDGRYIINNGKDSPNPNVDLDQVDWIRDAYTCEDYILTASHVQYVIRNNYKWVVTLSRPIQEKGTGKTAGVFFIDLNYRLLRDLCENNSLGLNSYVFIIDGEGNIIYHPKQQLLFRGLTTEAIPEVLNCNDTYFVTEEGGDSKLYTISRSRETGWSVVGVVGLSELMHKQDETQRLYLMTAVILILSGVLLATLLAGYVTSPLKVLKESMKEVEQGNFEGASIEHFPNNEIGALSNSFNVMTNRIRQLMEQNVYEQKQKRKSELKALRSQINPHFLYNTLDSIIWMAESNKNREVVLMTSSLAKLLRQSISNEDEIIPLRKEVDYTRSYLTIQKMRYQDKLEFSIDVDSGILEEGIINLILQPIVENAIYHGVKNKEGKGMVCVTGGLEGDDIVLKVKDNGMGMDQDTLEHIFDRSKEQESRKVNGVGVYNVNMRIRLYYGEKYGLSFESAVGEGTVATIRIPRQ